MFKSSWAEREAEHDLAAPSHFGARQVATVRNPKSSPKAAAFGVFRPSPGLHAS
jgi:hypothetical protein